MTARTSITVSKADLDYTEKIYGAELKTPHCFIFM